MKGTDPGAGDLALPGAGVHARGSGGKRRARSHSVLTIRHWWAYGSNPAPAYRGGRRSCANRGSSERELNRSPVGFHAYVHSGPNQSPIATVGLSGGRVTAAPEGLPLLWDVPKRQRHGLVGKGAEPPKGESNPLVRTWLRPCRTRSFPSLGVTGVPLSPSMFNYWG